MENSKVISLEERRIQNGIRKSRYEGAITVTIEGENLTDGLYQYELEYIEPKDVIFFFKDTLNALMEGRDKIEIAPDKILNRTVTILYYLPLYEETEFYFEWEPDQMTEEALIALLSCCILNMEQ